MNRSRLGGRTKAHRRRDGKGRPALVRQVLSGPGDGAIIVTDGGGSMRSGATVSVEARSMVIRLQRTDADSFVC
jgi:hypothetical protein